MQIKIYMLKKFSYDTIREVGFPRWHGYTTFGHSELETELAQSANSVIKKKINAVVE